MLRSVFLILSLALNVFLGGATIRFNKRHGYTAPETHAPAFISPRPKEPSLNPIPIVSIATNHFHWQILKTDDFVEYAANLRNIGCPEKTIRDIIVAEVDKLYALKIAMLSSGGFWNSGHNRQAAESARDERQQALEAEKRALLLRLSLEDASCFEPMSKDLESLAIFRFLLGPVPQGVLEKVMVAFEKAESLANQIQKESHDILLPEDETRAAELRRQFLAELNRLLRPDQLDEFALRMASFTMNNSLDGFRLTGAEFRRIAQLHVEVYGQFEDKPFGSPLSASEELDKSKQKEFDTRLRAFLGDARYGEYQRETDSDFKQLKSFTEQQHLPPEVALKVYDLKQLADSEQRRLREDAALESLERAARLGEVQDSTGAAVRELLGMPAFETYLRRGNGGWLTNLNQP
jgi:hypothetical protein